MVYLRDLIVFVLHRNITFAILQSPGCDPIDGFSEGVEFSIRFCTDATWIPIVLTVRERTVFLEGIAIGDPGDLVIRGYEVAIHEISDGTTYSVQICDFDEQVSFIQLRWLQTSRFDGGILRDIWIMDDVSVNYERDNETRMELLQDSFDGELKLVAGHKLNESLKITCNLQPH